MRFRFSGSEALYKWALEVDRRLVEYELSANLTISHSLFSVEVALEGIGLAYAFEQLALPHIQAKKLRLVLSSFSPTFPGFYLYYPSRRQQPSKLKAFVDYAPTHSRKHGDCWKCGGALEIQSRCRTFASSAAEGRHRVEAV